MDDFRNTTAHRAVVCMVSGIECIDLNFPFTVYSRLNAVFSLRSTEISGICCKSLFNGPASLLQDKIRINIPGNMTVISRGCLCNIAEDDMIGEIVYWYDAQLQHQ